MIGNPKNLPILLNLHHRFSVVLGQHFEINFAELHGFPGDCQSAVETACFFGFPFFGAGDAGVDGCPEFSVVGHEDVFEAFDVFEIGDFEVQVFVGRAF